MPLTGEPPDVLGLATGDPDDEGCVLADVDCDVLVLVLVLALALVAVLLEPPPQAASSATAGVASANEPPIRSSVRRDTL